MNEEILIAIVDDHALFRKGLAALINLFPRHRVVLEAVNGRELIEKLPQSDQPHIILLDVDMKEMNGYETADWLRANYPDIKVLALSILDTDQVILKMIRNGARGYVLKDADPEELRYAFEQVLSLGYYYNDLVTRKVLRSIHSLVSDPANLQANGGLSDREQEFLKLACSEKSYREIAEEMHLSERTIDGYRESLFKKCRVNTRVGLVLYAIRHNLITP
jgi:DNA-binding NarL/FixJ family response regulator